MYLNVRTARICAISDNYSTCFAVSLNLLISSRYLSVNSAVICLFNSSTSYDLT